MSKTMGSVTFTTINYQIRSSGRNPSVGWAVNDGSTQVDLANVIK